MKASNSVTRRGVLKLGQLAGLGIWLPEFLAATQCSAAGQTDSGSPKNFTATAKSCILVWLDGGPSHLETFDLKPNAPSEVRGPLQPISTAVAGISISECMPQLARRMQDIAIIRSMTSPLGEHNLGAHYMLTGYKPTPVLTYPSFHAVANQQVRAIQQALPNNIAIPEYRVGGGRYDGAGFLPSQFAPFSLNADPANPDFAVRDLHPINGMTLHRIDRRREFAQQLRRWNDVEAQPSNTLPADTPPADAASSLERALKMVTSPEAADAFRLDDESQSTRNRYGTRTVGQSCLLARRLVERGVRFVTVNQRGWDTHEDLYTRLKEGYTGAKVGVGLIPSLDLAVSALIDDLKDRNLLDETLVVIMGEFGRTPKINTAGGRDHWPRVFSVALAGGGIRGGQVVGSSDAVGESPADRPVTPADLASTIYTALGIAPSTLITTVTGRPIRLVSDESQVLTELLT